MKANNYLLIIFLIIFNYSYSQNIDCQEILPKFASLEFNLIRKDTAALNNLLHEKLSFGHSNGWIETKESLLNSLPTSKVKYISFSPKADVEAEFIEDKIVVLRRKQTVIGEYEGEHFDVDLKILEIWIKENKEWYLLARQSVEVEFEE